MFGGNEVWLQFIELKSGQANTVDIGPDRIGYKRPSFATGNSEEAATKFRIGQRFVSLIQYWSCRSQRTMLAHSF